MFGLDDEYTGGGKYAPGNKTEHTDFADKAGFSGAQHARSDSIMGSGTNVRPHHYVTFLDALKVVTGMDEWEYGKAARRVGSREDGRLPARRARGHRTEHSARHPPCLSPTHPAASCSSAS